MNLKDYQEKAVAELKAKANSLLELSGSKTIVFEAPTGAGKTVMMAGFLQDFVENRTDDIEFSIIWTAPRQLHIQSKEKLEGYYFDSKALRCSFFEELLDKRIGANEILFLNWESINKTDNIYIRENENDYNLSSIIINTAEERRTIILVIDESHFAAKTEISQELIQMIQPKVTVEVSATPHIQGDEKVVVHREKVIEEGMIKKSISLNPGFKNIIQRQKVGDVEILSDAAQSTNELVLKAAIDKRKEIGYIFKDIGSPVNPLTLIQLPDRKQGVEDIQEEIVQILKDNHHITTENGRLAIYLSENKENLENITRNDSEVEVMIFKQAIALGWDCPRACILVLFRDWKSITFSIQTIGRILRMPELKHYENDELNTGIVYTNLSDISIQEDIAGSYLTINFTKRIPDYKSISLNSMHLKRFREETRLSPQFIQDFLEAAEFLNLSKNINIKIDEIKTELISDGVITNPDKTFNHISGQTSFIDEHSAEMVEIIQTDKEVQVRFDLFIRDNLHPLAPEKRSIGRVKDSIYRFLRNNFPLMFEYGGVNAQMVVLFPGNQQLFIDTINKAKEIYSQRVGKDKREIIYDDKWEVPACLSLSNNYTAISVKHSILQPFYMSNSAYDPEKKFVEYLESKNDIEWWFKNGQQGGNFFAVQYVENGEDEAFYVDWIIKFKDGRIGLFDTKAGIYAKDAKCKAEGLTKYIKAENKKGKNLFGGVIIQNENSWRYNDKEKYEYNLKDLSEWKFL